MDGSSNSGLGCAMCGNASSSTTVDVPRLCLPLFTSEDATDDTSIAGEKPSEGGGEVIEDEPQTRGADDTTGTAVTPGDVVGEVTVPFCEECWGLVGTMVREYHEPPLPECDLSFCSCNPADDTPETVDVEVVAKEAADIHLQHAMTVRKHQTVGTVNEDKLTAALVVVLSIDDAADEWSPVATEDTAADDEHTIPVRQTAFPDPSVL